MARQRSHSIAFKRQIAREFIAGESLYALSKRHDISRQLIRVWVEKYEAGLGRRRPGCDLLQEYEAKIAALERMVGRQSLEIEFLKGALEKRTTAEKREYIRHCRPRGVSIAEGCRLMRIGRSAFYDTPDTRARELTIVADYAGTPINERHYPNARLATALSKAEAISRLMDGLGYNCFWLAEHLPARRHGVHSQHDPHGPAPRPSDEEHQDRCGYAGDA